MGQTYREVDQKRLPERPETTQRGVRVAIRLETESLPNASVHKVAWQTTNTGPARNA